MPKVIVKTGHPHDGEYDLDLSRFTWRERAYITETSGTLPVDYIKKWFDVDPMTVIATVCVMMQRDGVTPNVDALMDASSDDSIRIDYTDLEAEAEEAGGADPPGEASQPSGGDAGEKSGEPATGG